MAAVSHRRRAAWQLYGGPRLCEGGRRVVGAPGERTYVQAAARGGRWGQAGRDTDRICESGCTRRGMDRQRSNAVCFASMETLMECVDGAAVRGNDRGAQGGGITSRKTT